MGSRFLARLSSKTLVEPAVLPTVGGIFWVALEKLDVTKTMLSLFFRRAGVELECRRIRQGGKTLRWGAMVSGGGVREDVAQWDEDVCLRKRTSSPNEIRSETDQIGRWLNLGDWMLFVRSQFGSSRRNPILMLTLLNITRADKVHLK